MIRYNGQNVRGVWRNHAGTWRAYAAPTGSVWAKVDGTWRKAWPFVPPTPPVTGVTISPGTRQWSGGQAAFSAAPVGGTGPFQYAWSATNGAVVSSGQGTANVVFASSSGAQSTVSVTVTDLGSGTDATATATVTAAPVVQPLTASISPSSQNWSGPTGALTASFAANASGGSGSYGYAWSVSGGTITSGQGTPNLTISSANGAAATVSLTVSDTQLGGSVGASASVAARAFPPLTASIAPTSQGWSGGLDNFTADFVATIGGGSGSYAISWSAASASVLFGQGTTNVRVGNDTGVGAGVTLTVTDNETGLSVNATASVAAVVWPQLVVTAAPSDLSGSGPNTPVVTSGTATATVTGGSGRWTGVWEWDQGASTGFIVPSNAFNQTTGFQSGDTQNPGTSRGAGFRFRVTDTITGVVRVSNSVGVNLTRTAAALTVEAFPASQPWDSNLRASTWAEASGGIPPYTYGWDDTGPAPYPIGSGYGGPNKTWQSVNGRQDAFVSVRVTDSIGQTATASCNITDLG